jgi:hypothetical protein
LLRFSFQPPRIARCGVKTQSLDSLAPPYPRDRAVFEITRAGELEAERVLKRSRTLDRSSLCTGELLAMSSTALVLALSAAAAAFAPPGGRGTPATTGPRSVSGCVESNSDVKTIEKRDDFLDVGFLLTDYASDFYDGKQITLCVYI